MKNNLTESVTNLNGKEVTWVALLTASRANPASGSPSAVAIVVAIYLSQSIR
jgi:hypothetical protein